MRFQEYCADKKRKQSKESGEKREFKRTKAVVDQFFRNVEHFCTNPPYTSLISNTTCFPFESCNIKQFNCALKSFFI